MHKNVENGAVQIITTGGENATGSIYATVAPNAQVRTIYIYIRKGDKTVGIHARTRLPADCVCARACVVCVA